MDKSPNKRFWWDPLRDMYTEVYKEKLPQDWLAVVKGMTNTGLAFDNPCVDKWTIAVVEEVRWITQASSPHTQTLFLLSPLGPQRKREIHPTQTHSMIRIDY